MVHDALAALALLAVMAGALAWGSAAQAACCVCRSCPAAFCIDDVSLTTCLNACDAAGCPDLVYQSDDDCGGGCGGNIDIPTATPTATPSATPSASASTTPSETPTATPTASPSQTQTDTPTAAPTETPSPSVTPTATPLLSGVVLYYTGDRPVADVSMNLIGTNPTSTTTASDGTFGFSAVGPGNQSLEPAKTGDIDNAVTALDASYVLQRVAGLRTFTPDQTLACDVTGNGQLSALDGTRILQYQADLIQRFEAADECGSDWLFRPMPGPAQNQSLSQPVLAPDTCLPGAINYTPFVPPAAIQNFIAILLGDCTGNWHESP